MPSYNEEGALWLRVESFGTEETLTTHSTLLSWMTKAGFLTETERIAHWPSSGG